MNESTQFDQAQWEAFLAAWNEQFLRAIASLKDLESFCRAYDHLERPIGNRWLGEVGASGDDIATAETRLGTSFPKDYAAFLRATNGWVSPGFNSRGYLISPTHEVNLFALRNPQSLGVLLEAPEYYFREGSVESETDSAFLKRTFQISDDDNRAILLFDPEGGSRLFWHHDFHGPSRPFSCFTEMISYARPLADEDFAEVLDMHRFTHASNVRPV